MLKHDFIEEPAARIRVTPEELAAALARLEARREGEAGTTISIGEAVSELGVMAAPEAVWAEVQAARAQQTKAWKKRPTHRQRLALLSAAGLGLIGLIGWWSTPHAANDQNTPAVAVLAPQPAPAPISFNPDLLVGDTHGKLVMLSEVGDNQPVRCRYGDGSFQQFIPGDNAPLWELIKHGGKIYVRGRTLPMSPKVFSSYGADVTAVANDPGFSIPITLPVSGFEVVPGAGNDIQFHAVHIHLDQYANEKWKP